MQLAEILLVFVMGTMVLLMASKIDIDTRTVPTWIQAAMLGVFIIKAIFEIFVFEVPWENFVYQIAQGGITLLVLLLICAFTEKGNGEELFGGGDIRMIALVALLVSTEELLSILIGASFVMIFYALYKKKDGMDFKKMSLPYMPFLTIGWVVVEIWAIVNYLI